MVNQKSKVTPNTIIGDYVGFNGMVVKGHGKVVFGNYFHSGSDCIIISSNHNYKSKKSIPYDNTSVNRDVIIENNVWLGDRVIILGGVRIGEGAIIQAGSVVVNDIPKCAIVGGHPAKIFKEKYVEDYERLKNEGKFF